MAGMLRILLLSPFFYPERISTGRYNAHLAEHLTAEGHAVTVVCSHPLYPNWKPQVSDEELPGVQVHRGGGAIRYPGKMVLRRAVLEVWFAWHALTWLWRLRGKIDVVVAVFPPTLFAALALSIARVPWVGIVHDLQGNFAARAGGRLGRLVLGLIHRIERNALTRCATTVFLSETMKKEAIRQYQVLPSRCEVIYPGHNVRDTHVDDARVCSLLEHGVRHVVYAGALGHKQDPQGLLKLFTALTQLRKDVVCHIFSAGPVFEELRSRLPPDGPIRAHDLVAEAALATLLECSTVHVIHEVSGAGEGALPSKIANMLWMAVPVFSVCDEDGELARLVRGSGIGCVDSSFDTNRQAAALAVFVDTASGFDRAAEKSRLRPVLEGRFSLKRMPAILEAACDSWRAARSSAMRSAE